MAEALRFHDGKRYEIGAFVVMPNHVHLIIRPFRQALEVVLHSRKLRTARMINEALGRDGKLWQGESFDRIIRDAEHLYECVQYIGDNPRKAGLKEGESLRWIRPDWEDLGWRFDLKTPAT